MGPTQNFCLVMICHDDLPLCDMDTYKVTSQVASADGEPLVREVKGTYVFANSGALKIYGSPQENIAVFPLGELAAVAIYDAREEGSS